MNYSIVDIETTGAGNKITEISIFVFDGEKIIDEFTTLVNPESTIPRFIISLTGINNEMVKDAPKFYEIAKKVQEITKDTIFVAHNVSFDYGVIRKEFRELGGDFIRKKLCSVRLARKLLPGHKSYSLGKISKDLGIEINGRHRARGDAEATVYLFKKILANDPHLEVINTHLNPTDKTPTLPPLLDQSIFYSLPKTTGIYYFWNTQKQIIYVGKARDIKARVLSHFRTNSRKERKMTMEISDITFYATGNELIALLKESAEIKEHFPTYNKAQKRRKETFALATFTNQKGIQQITFGPTKNFVSPLAKFYNKSETISTIEKLINDFQLCPKQCGIEIGTSKACFNFHLKKCKGVCCEKESPEQYNERVVAAINKIGGESKTEILVLKGREPKEKGLVFIKDGSYIGYGFSKKRKLSFEACENEIISQNDNTDIKRILNYYRRKFDDYFVLDKTKIS